jgi:N-acetylneuraminic acid mutarotase
MLLGAIAPEAAAQGTLVAPMNQARWLHTATLLPNGKVLVVGGIGDSALASAELYDPATNIWGSATSLPEPRFLQTATLLPSGRILVLGGETGDVVHADAALYDPGTGTWSIAPSLPAPRYLHTATLLPGGTVLVVGGTPSDPNSPTSSAGLYSPATGTWSDVASLTMPRSRHTATLLPNGKVLVVGGDSGGQVLASGEIYDPATNSWSGAAGLMTARQRHAATLLPNGKVLVVGGLDLGGFFVGGNVLASAELYDPATNTWSSAASLTTARHRPTATLLPNGVVLIVGGMAGSGSVIASGEFYTAATTPPVEVVEFFNAALDHYFITWMPGEIAILDAGTTIKGWQRTDYTFRAFTIAQSITTPICRYYLPPQFGDSHFFGRGTVECNATGQNNPGFILEDPAFMQMFLPIAGNCPALTTPIYRVFSNRSDANHRYMTDRAVRDQMVARGWLTEGDGPDLVVMCAPG